MLRLGYAQRREFGSTYGGQQYFGVNPWLSIIPQLCIAGKCELQFEEVAG